VETHHFGVHIFETVLIYFAILHLRPDVQLQGKGNVFPVLN